MNSISSLFSPRVSQDQQPITSIYLSWDWTKPSASNRERLNEEMKTARSLLKQKLNEAEIQEYLAPFWNVMARIKNPLPDLAGLALFRTKSDFWYLQLTQDPGTFTVVADSFHVKPLYSTIQDRKRFAFLWFHESGATLAYGNDRQMSIQDTIIANDREKRSTKFFAEVKRLLKERVKDPRVEIVLTGDPEVIRQARLAKVSDRLASAEIHGFFSKLAMPQLEQRVKEFVKTHRRTSESQLLVSVFNELKWNRHEVETDIEKVAKLSVRGKIKTLIIAKDRKLFGQMNRKNGKLLISGSQLNCQDDDLYDDIAECAEAHGATILTAADKLIPGDTGIFAVLKEDELYEQMTVA